MNVPPDGVRWLKGMLKNTSVVIVKSGEQRLMLDYKPEYLPFHIF